MGVLQGSRSGRYGGVGSRQGTGSRGMEYSDATGRPIAVPSTQPHLPHSPAAPPLSTPLCALTRAIGAQPGRPGNLTWDIGFRETDAWSAASTESL